MSTPISLECYGSSVLPWDMLGPASLTCDLMGGCLEKTGTGQTRLTDRFDDFIIFFKYRYRAPPHNAKIGEPLYTLDCRPAA